ncbi:MAG: diguanylate cyclase [Clostridia bacterium]|nr:diguanylate cyclase [Clostridia bacterium]
MILENNPHLSPRTNRGIRLFYCAAIVLCLLCTLIGILFWHNIQAKAEAALICTLAEETNKNADNLNRQIAGVFNTLSGIANSIAAIDTEGPITPPRRLLSIKLDEDHLSLGYAACNGCATLYDNDGAICAKLDISQAEFFGQALLGSPCAEYAVAEPYADCETIWFAYPIWRGSQVQGALIAVYKTELFKSIIEQPVFDHFGYFNLTDAAGRLILRSDSPLMKANALTISQLGQIDAQALALIQDNMAQGQGGYYNFIDTDGRRMLAAYQPLETVLGPWFMTCAVDAQYVLFRTTSGKIPSLSLLIVAMLLYIGLFFFFAQVLRREQILLDIQTERSRILEETANEHLIDYNPATDTLRYSFRIRNGQIINGELLDILKEKKYRRIVSPEYWPHIEDATEKICREPGKITLECLSLPWMGGDDYEWCRLTLASVGDEKGRVISVLGRVENIQQLMKARENAAMDPMTGILNKVSLRKKISDALEEYGSANTATLMIDLDNFKQINDNYGHMVGDIVLQRLAQIMQRVFAVEDILGRFGGDEFVVFMQNISRENVEKRVSQFEDILRQDQQNRHDFINIPTPSIGIFYTKDNGLDVDTLIIRADQTMYEIKRRGKNGHSFWQQPQAESSEQGQ